MAAFKQNEDGSYSAQLSDSELERFNRKSPGMKVLMAGIGFGIENATEAAIGDVVAAEPIDFAIDVEPLMDQWGGGTIIADIDPRNSDSDVYDIAHWQAVPVTYRRTGDDSFILDAADGSWFLSVDGDLQAETSGQIPDRDDPAFTSLWEFLETFEISYSDIAD